jgi:acyl carrier protein
MSDELIRRVIACVARSQNVSAGEITIDSTFAGLGIDSLDAVNILFELESEFGIDIPDEGVTGIEGVRDMVNALEPLIGGAAAPAQP